MQLNLSAIKTAENESPPSPMNFEFLEEFMRSNNHHLTNSRFRNSTIIVITKGEKKCEGNGE